MTANCVLSLFCKQIVLLAIVNCIRIVYLRILHGLYVKIMKMIFIANRFSLFFLAVLCCACPRSCFFFFVCTVSFCFHLAQRKVLVSRVAFPLAAFFRLLFYYSTDNFSTSIFLMRSLVFFTIGEIIHRKMEDYSSLRLMFTYRKSISFFPSKKKNYRNIYLF